MWIVTRESGFAIVLSRHRVERRPAFRDDIDDDHASLLSGLNVTIGIGDHGERISAIDDRDESACFDHVLQFVHERLPASPFRQGNYDAPASGGFADAPPTRATQQAQSETLYGVSVAYCRKIFEDRYRFRRWTGLVETTPAPPGNF